jgi:Tfp pilus assembly protein PilF
MKIRYVLSLLMIALMIAVLDVNAQSGAAKGKGRLKGTVTDKDGKPIPGVTVRFASEKLRTSFEIKANDKGEWIVNGIAGGTWDMDFIKEGYVDRKIANQVTELSTNKTVEITMEKATSVSGAAGGQKQSVPGLDLVAEAEALRTAKDYPGAIAKYQAALQANPSLYKAWGGIGLIYSQMDQPDQAIEAFNKLLESEPDNVDARIEIANLWFKKGNAEEAKKVLAQIDLSKVTDPYKLYNIGVGFYNAQQSEEAVKYWEKAVELDPKMTDGWFQLALGYYAMKNTDKAKQAFQKVIELDPSSENAKMAQEMLDGMQ